MATHFFCPRRLWPNCCGHLSQAHNLKSIFRTMFGMGNYQAIVFAILLVWVLMGFLMIKGNDHCCPSNRKICESDAGTMFSQSSVDLSREVMLLSHDSQRTCANYYDLDIDRCTGGEGDIIPRAWVESTPTVCSLEILEILKRSPWFAIVLFFQDL